MKIEFTTYEQDRLNHFEYLMDKANKRYQRLYARFKDAPYLSVEAQVLSDAGRETRFLADVVEMLDKGYRKQEWISVEDRLPEREGQYLVYTFGGVIRVCRFRTSIITDRLSFEYSCTHWMPLPELPKMKGGAE